VHLHLRAETKPAEHRSALTPTTTAALLKAGLPKSTLTFTDEQVSKFPSKNAINESLTTQNSARNSQSRKKTLSEQCCSVGAELVDFGSWRTADKSTYIIGLKELPENDNSPLPHTHIMFAHCFKNQVGWQQVLARWPRGGGTLLDLEFLTDANGRRVAAFGYYAGFAGAAVGLQVWAWQKRTGGDASDFPGLKPFPNEAALLAEVREHVTAAVQVNGGTWPRVIVIGALGRCGSGAVDAAIKVGVPDENVLKWDMAETAHGGPFPEILECMVSASKAFC